VTLNPSFQMRVIIPCITLMDGRFRSTLTLGADSLPFSHGVTDWEQYLPKPVSLEVVSDL
jgi:hypothetical protein